MHITMPDVSPNRVVAAAIFLFIVYWIAAMFVSPVILRDLFNSLAFGVQTLVVVTWASGAYKAVKSRQDEDGAWVLVLAVFYISLVAMAQRFYSIAFNYMGRPEAWSESPISGFWPYSYMIAACMFLISPGVRSDGIQPKAWWMLVGAAALGGFVAGIVFMMQLTTT